MKSKRTALLKKIFAGRNLVKDATDLGIDLAILLELVGDPSVKAKTNTPIHLTADAAVRIGKLLSVNPRDILSAQTDDELLSLGIASVGVVVTSEVSPATAPVKEVKVKKPAKAKPAGSRSPFGGRSSFILD